ncbi:TnsA endonuclease N-terminal domain-containing protein [Marinicellulosiphila megalodicopiae]|uniref:TnsA endonuclease N-terminal domain-containing protein n=1 Tax=Marinicellulosiphila megalodicopiae TaxID=2724896 RepID=UPI003BAE8D5B
MPEFAKKSFKVSAVKNRGMFPSHKSTHGMAYVDSILEVKYCHLLERDDCIVDFIAQPFKFRWEDQGVKFIYTPDFYVLYENGSSEYVEVKLNKSKVSQDLNTKLKSFSEVYLPENEGAVGFTIVYENEIKKGNLIKNISFLFRFIRAPVLSVVEINKIVNVYGNRFTVTNAVRVIGDEYLDSIYSSVYFNVLCFDMINDLFTSSSVVEVAHEQA